eukprot:6172458-Pleurochrysis_carterae.AAC.4
MSTAASTQTDPHAGLPDPENPPESSGADPVDAFTRAFRSASSETAEANLQPYAPRWAPFACSTAKSLAYIAFALLLPLRVAALAEACASLDDDACDALWTAPDTDPRVHGIAPSWTLVMLPLLLYNVLQVATCRKLECGPGEGHM